MIYKHKLINAIALISAVSLMAPVATMAQDYSATRDVKVNAAVDTTTSEQKTPIEREKRALDMFRVRRQKEMEINREKLKNSRNAFRARAKKIEGEDNTAKDTRVGTTTAPEQKTPVERAKNAGDIFRTRMRKEREANRKKIETSREAFRKRAREIKDAGKRNAFERVTDRIERVNSKLVERYGLYIDKLEFVLNKIEDRTKKAEERGVDTTKVRASIEDARALIESARNAVLEQDARVYTLSKNVAQNEVGSALRDIVKELRDDHRAIRNGILRDTRNSIHGTVQILKDAITPSANGDTGKNNE